jgi:hypothetical protein
VITLYVFITIVVATVIAVFARNAYLKAHPPARFAVREFIFEGKYAEELITLYDAMCDPDRGRLASFNLWTRISDLLDQSGCDYHGNLSIVDAGAYHTRFRIRDHHVEEVTRIPRRLWDITAVVLDPDNKEVETDDSEASTPEGEAQGTVQVQGGTGD